MNPRPYSTIQVPELHWMAAASPAWCSRVSPLTYTTDCGGGGGGGGGGGEWGVSKGGEFGEWGRGELSECGRWEFL